MAKISFSKLGLKKNEGVKTVKINDLDIEVKQYLPVNDKLILISNVINAAAAQGESFRNPVKIDVFGSLEIVYNYTNLIFTDKQKEDPGKLYDLLEQNGILNKIIEAIPEEEYNFLIDGIDTTVDSFYEHQSSALGILEAVNTEYSNLDLDASAIQSKLNDEGNLELLREVLTKMG